MFISHDFLVDIGFVSQAPPPISTFNIPLVGLENVDLESMELVTLNPGINFLPFENEYSKIFDNSSFSAGSFSPSNNTVGEKYFDWNDYSNFHGLEEISSNEKQKVDMDDIDDIVPLFDVEFFSSGSLGTNSRLVEVKDDQDTKNDIDVNDSFLEGKSTWKKNFPEVIKSTKNTPKIVKSKRKRKKKSKRKKKKVVSRKRVKTKKKSLSKKKNTKESPGIVLHGKYGETPKEEYSFRFRPCRRLNTAFAHSGLFPEVVCSSPYKYLVKIEFPEKYKEQEFDFRLLGYQSKQKRGREIEDGIIVELKRVCITPISGKFEQIYSIQLKRNKFFSRKTLFEIEIYDENNEMVFKSQKFRVVARKVGAGDGEFWDQFPTVDKEITGKKRRRKEKKDKKKKKRKLH